jgi:hypothetical protein
MCEGGEARGESAGDAVGAARRVKESLWEKMNSLFSGASDIPYAAPTNPKPVRPRAQSPAISTRPSGTRSRSHINDAHEYTRREITSGEHRSSGDDG